MFWQIIIAISISFVIPILWKIAIDREYFYIFYIFHIFFGQLFFIRFYYTTTFENILFQRSFLGFSFISYAIFLYFLFKSLDIKVFIANRNINSLLIYCLLSQVIFSGIIKRLTESDLLSNYTIELFNCIAIFLFTALVYQLITKYRKLKYALYIALGISFLTLGTIVGHLFYYNIAGSYILNPYYIAQYTFLFELMIFNGVIFYISADKRSSYQSIILQNKYEISKLERSALQAQMNPHFIFNCLNSIQNYIMRNDKDVAMDYLGRFATLIRQYLHASTKDLVTLDDEISMLTNYLHLEQMRFNQSFEYHFQIDKIIDPTEISLPPLLIQPFVENAILHGMTSITNGGQINIGISKKENQLHITIKDNGKGFDKNKNSGMRKSLGISITQKRLQYINDHSAGNYAISTRSDESGTEINITVKLT